MNTNDFDFLINNERRSLEDLFPRFNKNDRIGIVVRRPGGSAGASALLMAAITRFYDFYRPQLGDEPDKLRIYPEYFIFHLNIFNFTPERNFWVVFTGIASIALILADVLSYLNALLTIQGVFLLSWSAVLLCDALVVKKLLKIGPKYYEHRQQYLFSWNPIGIVSLVISSVLGSIAAFGSFGEFLQNTAAFFAMILAALITLIMAIATKGKYYIKKEAKDIPSEEYIA
jgi:hypothetical protein